MQVFTHASLFKMSRLAATLLVMFSGAMSAHATEATGAQLKAVKLYGNVSIADDDIQAWGPWEQLEPPQAGPSTSLRRLTSDRDLYRPLATTITKVLTPPTTPSDFVCEGGSVCGFGVMYTLEGATEVPSENTSGVKQPQVMRRPIASTALHEVSIGGLGSEVDESGRPMQIALKLVSVPDGSVNTLSPMLWQATESSYYAMYVHADTDTALRGDANLNRMDDGELYNYLMGKTASLTDCDGPCLTAGATFIDMFVGKTSTAEQVSAAAASYGSRIALYSGQERGWTAGTSAGYPALYGKVSIQVDFSKKQFTYNSTMNGGYQATGNLTSTGYVANSFSSGVSGALKGYFVGSQANTTLGGAHLEMDGTKVDSYHMTTAVTKE
ncbi:MAG TPA: hypothetical protein VFW93_08140 [Aquabacterium sp.]|uniref:hypothetical protein n=1 Tax=Aquabacterium sp. TaxID=1872578 RepID=UPI002E373941|nr:hypothetical protein [Aquabacterium sp.]HEX5356173.1 hypothetical protein [Aquabacterium sp.]